MKKIFCSAGISHMVICPNGDVYRCMSDYNYRASPIFNVKDGWKPLQECLPCQYDRCDSDCDIDWATKWLVEDGKKNEIIKARCELYLPEEGKSFAEQKLEAPLKEKVHIIWLPTFFCNYRCKYCGIDKNIKYKENNVISQTELSLEEWFSIWNTIYNNYACGFISISGGEPLLSKATVPIVALISEKFSVDIVTNLSIDTNIMGLVRSGIRSGSHTGIRCITASLHPSAMGFNREFFFSSVLYLKKHGFYVLISLVGYPLQLFLAPDYKKWCDEHGLDFLLIDWTGRDIDGFPAKYDKKEVEFFEKFTGQKLKNCIVDFNNFTYKIKIDSDNLEVEEGKAVILRGSIKNTGNSIWSNIGMDELLSFKVGARLMPFGNEARTLKEYRTPLPKIEISPREAFDFDIRIDTETIPVGSYTLKVDVVKESEFWFEDKGIEPTRLRLRVLGKSSK